MVKVLPAALAALACACGSNGSPKPVLRITYSIDLEKAVDELRAHPDDPVDAPRAAAARAAALDQAVTTIRARIRDVKGAKVAADGDRIVVDLPSLADERRAAVEDVIARRGELVIQVADNDAPAMGRIADVAGEDPDAQSRGVTVQRDQWQLDTGGVTTDRYLAADDREVDIPIEDAKRSGCYRRDLVRDGRVSCTVTGRQAIADYLRALGERDPALRLPATHVLGYQRVDPAALAPRAATDRQRADDRRPFWRTYYLAREPRLTGADIAGAEVVRGGGDGRPEVLVTLDDRGRQQLADITGASVGKKLAIVLDDVVEMAPVVAGPITGGRVTITLGNPRDAEREARELAHVLRAGALPAPLREESVTQLGPASP